MSKNNTRLLAIDPGTREMGVERAHPGRAGRGAVHAVGI